MVWALSRAAMAGGCVHGHVGESRVESESMYLNICVCSCTRVPVCVSLSIFMCVYICEDSRQGDWWAAGGERGRQQ